MIGELVSLGERLAGKRDPRFYRGLVYAAAEAAVTAAIYAVLYSFLEEVVFGTLTRERVFATSALLLGLVIVQTLFARPAFALVFTASFSLMGHARIRVLDHLRRLPMSFFGTRRAGELAGVVTTDLALIEDIWAHTFALFTSGLLLPLFVGAWLCTVDLRLGVAVVLTLPLAFAVLSLTLPLLERRVAVLLSAVADVNARTVEYVQGIAVLRAFGRYGDGFERLRAALERLRDAQIQSELRPAPLLAAYGFTVEMSFVLVALIGSYLMLGGTLSAETLLLFLLVSAGVSRRLFEFGAGILKLRTAQQALARVEAILNEPVLPEPPGALAEPQGAAIELDGVSFAYAGEQVLKDVSATIPERRLTAVVGPSGAGKSTLVHLIARLWDLERGAGAIRVGGVDVRDLPFERLHEKLAMVFQDVVLFSGSVLENLRVGKSTASFEEVVSAAKAAQAHDFICALPNGYDTRLGEGGATLSGGEKQRLSIARAILKDAPIVLLDEATASVDAFAESEIQRAIDHLVQTRTVVVIAHQLRTVMNADQILVLDQGRLVERGRHEELLARGGVYASLFQRHEQVKSWLDRARRQV